MYLPFLQVEKVAPSLTLLQHAVLALILSHPRVGGSCTVGLLGHSEAGRECFSQGIHGDTVNTAGVRSSEKTKKKKDELEGKNSKCKPEIKGLFVY